MYIPKEFVVHDSDAIRLFLNTNRFGTFVINGLAGFPEVVHVPFSYHEEDGNRFVAFHVAAQNDVIHVLRQTKRAKLIVLGAHGYISSSVYTHVNVPTYNYQAVHVCGKVVEMHTEDLKKHLESLVVFFEKNRKEQWKMNEFPEEMLQVYLKDIVGFRLEMEELEAAFKLSQNRNQIDFERIVDDLKAGKESDRALAEAMKHSNCPIR